MFKDHAMKISCIALTKIMDNLEKKTDNFLKMRIFLSKFILKKIFSF